MKSDGLKEKIQGYENYIAKNGIDETVMRAYVQACNVADQMKDQSTPGGHEKGQHRVGSKKDATHHDEYEQKCGENPCCY